MAAHFIRNERVLINSSMFLYKINLMLYCVARPILYVYLLQPVLHGWYVTVYRPAYVANGNV